MKYLQVLNWAALFAGAAMTLVLTVVVLMLWANQADAAAVGSRLGPVLAATAMFGAFTAAAALAVWGGRRQGGWQWVGEGALIAAGFALVQFVRALG